MTILLVDDERGTLLTFSIILRAAGFQVIVASNGRVALDLAAECDFDVVIVDQHMPGMAGVEVIQRLTGAGCPCIKILRSVFPTEDLREEALRVGADYFVAGILWGPNDLTKMVAAVLARGCTPGVITNVTPIVTPIDRRLAKAVSLVPAEVASVSLARMADAGGLSESWFRRLFERSAGLNVKDFLTNVRLLWSAHLLMTTSWPVHRIARAAGFLDLRYFRRAFRGRFATPPVHYRLRYRRRGQSVEDASNGGCIHSIAVNQTSLAQGTALRYPKASDST